MLRGAAGDAAYEPDRASERGFDDSHTYRRWVVCELRSTSQRKFERRAEVLLKEASNVSFSETGGYGGERYLTALETDEPAKPVGKRSLAQIVAATDGDGAISDDDDDDGGGAARATVCRRG